jgi:hypothetical protein
LPATIGTCRRASTASPKCKQEDRPLLRRLVYVALFIEIGLLLIVLPWSTFWDENYFASVIPALERVFTNNFVRGGVTGLGFVNLVAGVSELTGIFALRDRSRASREVRPPNGDPFRKESDARVEP